ncbi:MAG: S-adenosyl-l-methionine hydroxide adenosyltransferase family protein [Lentisphaerota bacterium]
MKIQITCILTGLLLWAAGTGQVFGASLVYQTDFGLKDGAVCAMKGVAVGVDPELNLYDLTHEIPPFNIWEGAYRLHQTVAYWPSGTVFVSVVDPGVGTQRRSVAIRTKAGHLVVTPDNGTLTWLVEIEGIAEARQIDEAKQRRPGSNASHTFFGRDLYSYMGARLAAGKIGLEDVGPLLDPAILVIIPHQKAEIVDGALCGAIPALDKQFGNVWTSIGKDLFDTLRPAFGDEFNVSIRKDGKEVYSARIPYVETFGKVTEGAPLLYLNSLLDVSFAINMGSFAEKHGIGSGPEWIVQVQPVKAKAGRDQAPSTER